jgi:hypothetical protein
MPRFNPLAAAALLLAAPAVQACVPITAVPATISAPGTYCLTGDLTHPGSGTAISIAADHVTLDLGGYSITGSNAGIGVSTSARNQVLLRNGRLLKFATAVSAVNPLHFTVEDLHLSGVQFGIAVTNGSYIAVQRNRVFDAGTTGIAISGAGPGQPSLDYVATVTHNELAAIGGIYTPVAGQAFGIRVDAAAAIVRGNRIAGVQGAAGSAAILAGGGSLVVENQSIAVAVGTQCIAGSPSEKSARNAVVMGASAYLNCLQSNNQ